MSTHSRRLAKLGLIFLGLLLFEPLAVQASLHVDDGQNPRQAKLPNVVLAFADDLGRYASAYADPKHPSVNDVVQTPNFDRICREGTQFQNAFVSCPSCTPSRAALVAARHFFRNGSHSQLHHPWVNGFPDPWDEVKGFPLMLQEEGYHIGWSYKMHISEDRMGGKERNYRRAGSKFNAFSQNVSKAEDVETGKRQLFEEVRKNFRAFLADREADQPFFYWFNPTNTHRAWVAGSGKDLWGIKPDDLKERLPSFLPDEPEIRQDMADYLGEAMAFDAAVGVLLEELESIGELDSTMFIVSGDHGAPGFPRGKCNLYDFGTQVPLAIRMPQQVAPGRVIETPVSLIDLGPTILQLAGLAPSSDMDGQSLLSAMDADESDPENQLRQYVVFGRENHVDEARPGGLPYPMRAIRTDEHLLIINFAPDRWPVAQPPLSAPLLTRSGRGLKDSSRRRMDIDFGPTRDFFVRNERNETYQLEWMLGFGKRPRVELYDVSVDPHQISNLATSQSHEQIRLELEQRLMQILRDGKDPRVLGDGSAFDLPPYAKSNPNRGVVDLQKD